MLVYSVGAVMTDGWHQRTTADKQVYCWPPPLVTKLPIIVIIIIINGGCERAKIDRYMYVCTREQGQTGCQ